MSDTPSDAEEVPAELLTWDYRPETTLYRREHELRLLAYVQGAWRPAVVTSKERLPDGRTSVQCAVSLPAHITGPSWQPRHLWWSAASMRPAGGSTKPSCRDGAVQPGVRPPKG